MKVLLKTILLALLLASPLAAQGETTYGARLSSGLVRLGEELTLIVQVENARSAELKKVHRVDGLRIGAIGQPYRREYQELSPGRRIVTITRTWQVPIRALEVGEYDVPGVLIEIDGRDVTTDPMRLKVVEDLKGSELGFFDVSVPDTEIVEGQPIVLEMTFGWDAGLSSRINVANLILPWWGRLPELLELETPPALTAQEVQISLNDSGRIVVDEIPSVTRNGRRFRSFRLRRVFLPTRPLSIDLPQPFLEFGQHEQRGFLGTSRGKRETYFVSGDAVSIEVVPLPTEGRPLDYTGAIGTMAVAADAEPRDVDVGDSIKLAVTYTGDGNHQFYDAPDISRDDAFDGFRVFGRATKTKNLSRHEVVYDLAPLSDSVSEIPPIRLSAYDPVEKAYVEVATERIPIRVRPLESPVSLTAEGDGTAFANDIRDVVAELPGNPGEKAAAPPGPVALALLGGGVLFFWLALRTEVRRRRGDPDAPLERRRRRALKALGKELGRASEPSEELRALLRFLAARTRESDWAWVGRDPVEHLEAHTELGDGAQGSRDLAQAIARLERATYATRKNGDAHPKQGEILELAGRLVRGGL